MLYYYNCCCIITTTKCCITTRKYRYKRRDSVTIFFLFNIQHVFLTFLIAKYAIARVANNNR